MAKQIILEDQLEELIKITGEKLDNITLVLAGISENGGDGLKFKSPKTLQALNRMGLAARVLDEYTQIAINRETSISIAAHGAITAPSVNAEIFVAKIGEAETKEYEFVYDGSAWKLEEHVVVLSEYGVSYSGTPTEGDTLVVHETAAEIIYDVLGVDHDVPSDPNFTHTITLCAHDCEQYGVLAYKKPQSLVLVPDAILAGTVCTVRLINGAYDASTSEDGYYSFTAPSSGIPAGAAIRHTQIGVYRSTYGTQYVIAGTFTVYDTKENGRTTLASGLTTSYSETLPTGATLLGTCTADTRYDGVMTVNPTRRNAYGSNENAISDERQWLNARTPAGTKANGDMNWHELLSDFDLPATANIAGYLYGMDPLMVEVMGKVRKRTWKHQVDRAANETYVDTDELVFSLSGNECGLQTTNYDGVYENAVGHDGSVKTTPYPYYQIHNTAAQKIKYQNGTPRYWWLRSPLSYSHFVRYCASTGTLSSNYANNPNGAVAAFNIV